MLKRKINLKTHQINNQNKHKIVIYSVINKTSTPNKTHPRAHDLMIMRS